MPQLKNKRVKKIILVTGGMGFIGSNYLNICVPRYVNYQFINIDILTYAAHKDNVHLKNKSNYLFKKIDIRDQIALEKLFNKYQPTDIINFAAESHVDISIAKPDRFIDTNIVGVHNLLALAKKYHITRFHQISTDEVYGSLTNKHGAFSERTPLAPSSPYSASKAAADMLALAYYKTFNLDVVITRCSNNYGPNQDKTKLIPRFITLLLENKKVPLYSKGQNIRDWIYVSDHVEAIDLVFHKGKSGQVYNVGGGKDSEKTNLEITEILLKLCGKTKEHIEYVADRPGHDFRYAIDFTKIRTELGWKPKVNFNQGIMKTIDFYKKLPKRKN